MRGSLRATVVVVPVLMAAAPAGKSQFWSEREAAYRESPRGPFTAVHAEYVERGGGVLLLATADTVWVGAEGEATFATEGLRVELGPEGFGASPGQLGCDRAADEKDRRTRGG